MHPVRYIHVLTLLTFLLVCSLASNCFASPDELLGAQEPWMQEYLKIKKIGTAQAAKQGVLTRFKYPPEGIISLGVCSYWTEDLGIAYSLEQRVANYLDLAGFVYNWRHELSQTGGGIPQKVWEPVVLDVERTIAQQIAKRNLTPIQTDKMANRFARYMGETLVAWSKRHKAHRLPISVYCEGGAGGGTGRFSKVRARWSCSLFDPAVFLRSVQARHGPK